MKKPKDPIQLFKVHMAPTAAEEVAKIVVTQMNKDLVWAPKIFQYISFVLCRIPQLKYVANKLFNYVTINKIR